AEVAHLFEQLMGGEAAALLPFVDVGVDLALDEFANRVAQFVMLLVENHDATSWNFDQKRATPKVFECSSRCSARSHRSSSRASTARVSRGSMMPSSQSRAEL